MPLPTLTESCHRRALHPDSWGNDLALLYRDTDRRWVDVLPTLIKEYNARPHKGLGGLSPDEACEPKNGARVLALNQAKFFVESKPSPVKFKIGDWVRVSRDRGVFEKAAHIGWTQEVFEVVGVRRGTPVTYTLQPWGDKEPLKGTFYAAEMQRTVPPTEQQFLVEDVKARRTVKGQKQVLVSWQGFPSSKLSWLDEDDPTVQFFGNRKSKAAAKKRQEA